MTGAGALPRRGARGLRRARAGIAAVEFAVGAAFLSLALLGLYDFGRASWQRMQVATAAQAGATYAAGNGFNTNGIVAAVRGATDLATVAATPAPSMVCGCQAGGDGITPVACGSKCGGTVADAGYYVQVNARAEYAFVFPYPFVASPVVMTATVTARLQ
jgi:Flp pilus assembly protein TadG